MPQHAYVVHKCTVPFNPPKWPSPGWRPLNLDAGHDKCPYCGVELAEHVQREYPQGHSSPHGIVKKITHVKDHPAGHRELNDAEYEFLRGGAPVGVP